MAANRLRETRRDQGRTVTWLADRINKSRQTIYALESGEAPGTLEVWIDIAEALGVPLGELAPEASKQVDRAVLAGKGQAGYSPATRKRTSRTCGALARSSGRRPEAGFGTCPSSPTRTT
jgi:DNA-binding XRE family transcriptional regulator